jgi:hypothetical protein
LSAAADGTLGIGGAGMGAWIWFRHDGQGPTTPARLDGTVSLIPQAGQKKEIDSLAMLWRAFRQVSRIASILQKT